ncbi:MAG: hypothetical protein LBT22_03345, partial [Peptococcaceae bacterium]|nr:hypothetical protein [Peptococcaceae bacterium]
TAVSGTIKHEVKVAATYANLETLIHAAYAGTVQLAEPDGRRLRRYETALSIQANGMYQVQDETTAAAREMETPVSGLIYHTLDGLETVMTPDNLLNMELSRLLQLEAAPVTPAEVQIGEPACKIVDNLSPTSAFIALPDVENIEIDESLRFIIDGQTQTAKVKRKSDQPQGVVVQFTQFISSSVKQRTAEILWIERSPLSGTLVPLKAITVRGEEQGVYAVLGNIIHFRPVKIIDDDGEQACIENISVGISVVENPRDGLEGKFVPK